MQHTFGIKLSTYRIVATIASIVLVKYCFHNSGYHFMKIRMFMRNNYSN